MASAVPARTERIRPPWPICLTARERRWELAAVVQMSFSRSLAPVASLLLLAAADAAPLTPPQRRCQESIARAGHGGGGLPARCPPRQGPTDDRVRGAAVRLAGD